MTSSVKASKAVREYEWMSTHLWDDRDARAQISQTQQRDLDVIDEDVAGRCFDETEESERQRRLSRTCPTDDAHLHAMTS